MNRPYIRKAHLFFSSIFIFLLHFPFVFAKSRSVLTGTADKNPVVVADSAAASKILVTENIPASVYDSLKLAALGMTKQVFDYAMKGFISLKEAGKLKDTSIISIADLSKSSCKKRLFVIDLKNCKLLFNTYVAHGMNSGQEYARQFSNIPESNKSSIGFFETADTYSGKHGYSLHLVGMEKGINDNASKRDIVMHGAEYVSESRIQAMGYIGRSQGCPAIPERLHKPIIDKIKNGTCLFIFGDDRNYFRRSAMVNAASPLLAYN
jgi:L,D-transpeptidase catalytic domain